jgi:ferrous iron transport protein B
MRAFQHAGDPAEKDLPGPTGGRMILAPPETRSHVHGNPSPSVLAAPVLLFGQPNVGKSALFNALTGARAMVSNYPGTTVGIGRGKWRLDHHATLVIKDAPGAYSLMPVTDDERIARDCLFSERHSVILHVVDGKNLDRSLTTTLELLDAELPVILVVNMIDECERAGINVDVGALAQRLGCPVVATAAVIGRGIRELEAAVERMLAMPRRHQGPGRLWREEFGPLVDQLAVEIPDSAPLPHALPRAVAAAMILRGSKEYAERSQLPAERVRSARGTLQSRLGGLPPVAAILALRRRTEALLDGVYRRPEGGRATFASKLGFWLAHPLAGLVPLVLVLYLGFYQLVGVFGAGTVVGFLEEEVFGLYVNPFFDRVFTTVIPWSWLQALFVGEYGMFTLGITYALALVLPVVASFFVVFSIVEDSGYFPRLALLCDRLFHRVGLNGRAVITMVLGLGCATMSTATTRTLETRRERILATLLLVLAVPCSAQLGLITALLGSRGIWLWTCYLGALLLVFFTVGYATARVLPGRSATFHMELVPMRVPRLRNVTRKTWMRVVWYLREVVPLFLIASVILWALDQTGSLAVLQRGMEPMMALIGMPIEAAESFLIGFFRRDFGAAGLFSLGGSEDGARLSDRQLLVGAVTLTLFVPCVATFMMMWKERGGRVASAIFALVTALAFTVGAMLNRLLLALGWS